MNTPLVYVVITTKTNIGVKFILVLGSIFFRHSVVGGVLQKIVVKYGARTHSARRYTRTHAYIILKTE